MQTQTITFAVEVKDKVVKRIGKSILYQPKTNFKNGSITFCKDKLKESGVNNDNL